MNKNTIALTNYYKLHAPIYDSTRWTFLFGRKEFISHAVRVASPRSILEVGCGTGYNLINLANLCPNAIITGIDISSDMLARARTRIQKTGANIQLFCRAYDESINTFLKNDLIIFSYSLSMFNPGWEKAIALAAENLKSNGHLAVLDFYDTKSAYFRAWMKMNHVRMDGHLLDYLHSHFSPVEESVYNAYFGLWSYFMFIK